MSFNKLMLSVIKYSSLYAYMIFLYLFSSTLLSYVVFINFFKIKIFYLFTHDRPRETETQTEGKAGSMQGVQYGTRSQDSRITPWAKGRCLTTESPRDPSFRFFFQSLVQLLLRMVTIWQLSERNHVIWIWSRTSDSSLWR